MEGISRVQTFKDGGWVELGSGGADPLRVARIDREWRATRMVWLFLDLVDRDHPDLGLAPACAALWPLLFDSPALLARYLAFHPLALGRLGPWV